MEIRAARIEEVPALARLWHSGWKDAHAGILPEALARTRTPDSFRQRLLASLSDTRVAGPPGAPLGLHMLKADELNQLYVAAEARGTGIASALLADAESRLAARGVLTAWLSCAIGNDRAARFYAKSGWRYAGTLVTRLETIEGPFDLEVLRYEKTLARPGTTASE